MFVSILAVVIIRMSKSISIAFFSLQYHRYFYAIQFILFWISTCKKEDLIATYPAEQCAFYNNEFEEKYSNIHSGIFSVRQTHL